jgi:hypothetical protein
MTRLRLVVDARVWSVGASPRVMACRPEPASPDDPVRSARKQAICTGADNGTWSTPRSQLELLLA